MDLHVGGGFVLTTQGKYLACGCADGLIRCFDADDINYIITLPRPPSLGGANVSPDKNRATISKEPDSTFADTMGLLFFDNNTKLYALYSDKTVFIWDILNFNIVAVFRASLHHSAAINQIQILPTSTPDVTKFATASNDKTIRFWHLHHSDIRRGVDTEVIKNIYSRELSRIVYVSKSYEHFKQKSPEGDGCIKCIACSPNGKHIASGDIEGVLRVHLVDNLEEILCLQAHDSEIVTLDYNMHTPREGEGEKGRMLLASGSRDRLLHIFDVESDYRPIITIDDHNSSISDLTFIRVDSTDKLISCGADRSLVFRNISGQNAIRYFQTIQKNKKYYSIFPHPINKTIITGEDKSVKVLLLETGKTVKEFEDYQDRGAKVVNDSNLKVVMDPTGLIFAAYNSDRTVRIIDYLSTRVIGRMNVGETVTSMVFSPYGNNLLTTTIDGCIFVWKLSLELTNAIRARIERAPIQRVIEIEDLPERPKPAQEEIKKELEKINDEHKIIGHESILPSWAKDDSNNVIKKSPFEIADEPIPGKWGKNPMKLDIDDHNYGLQKIEIYKSLEEYESDEEIKAEEIPVLATDDIPNLRESFILTKSIAFTSLHHDIADKVDIKEEEEIKEETPNDEAFLDIEDDNDDEEEKLPELEPESTFVKNPMRQSLSASFWQKKQEDHGPEKVGLFNYEPIVAEPFHVPKIIDFKKKQEVQDVKSQIDDMKKQLRELNILSLPKKIKKAKEQPAPEIIIPIDIPTDIPEEILIETPEEIPEEIKCIDDSPKEIKENKIEVQDFEENPNQKLEVPKKFDSPYTKNHSTENRSYIDFSISESQFSHSVKLSKNQYTQGFADLKRSLQDVDAYFSSIDVSDPEYSVSFEESHQDRKEILTLLMNISAKMGEQLALSKENELIEKFSKRLVSTFEKKIRKKEREKVKAKERKYEKVEINEI